MDTILRCLRGKNRDVSIVARHAHLGPSVETEYRYGDDLSLINVAYSDSTPQIVYQWLIDSSGIYMW